MTSISRDMVTMTLEGLDEVGGYVDRRACDPRSYSLTKAKKRDDYQRALKGAEGYRVQRHPVL
jgi:hypothetical protein